jgi:anti-sigma factor RsiW
MSLSNDTLQINAFVDGELDLAAQLEMEARLAADPALRRQVEESRQLRASIREGADYHAAPPGLRARLTARLAPPPAAAAPVAPTPRPGALAQAVQRWFGWRPLAASMSLALVLALAINVAWLQTSRQEQLGEDVLASHVRSVLGQHLVDVASSDHHTVKPFLSSRLGFSPPVDALQVPGSVFLGGRVDYLDGRPVAALVYRQGEHIVNSFVWPGQGGDSTPSYAAQRGYQTAHWTHRGMHHWVISDVNREEFRAIVKAVQQTDEAAPPGS